MNEVKWSKKAIRQLAKIPIKYRIAITDATRTLVNYPECKNVKPLKNHIYDFLTFVYVLVVTEFFSTMTDK